MVLSWSDVRRPCRRCGLSALTMNGQVARLALVLRDVRELVDQQPPADGRAAVVAFAEYDMVTHSKCSRGQGAARRVGLRAVMDLNRREIDRQPTRTLVRGHPSRRRTESAPDDARSPPVGRASHPIAGTATRLDLAGDPISVELVRFAGLRHRDP